MVTALMADALRAANSEAEAYMERLPEMQVSARLGAGRRVSKG